MNMLSRRIMGVADEFRADLATAGLSSFDRLMSDAAVGEVIASEPGREIRRLHVPCAGESKVFFLKRTWPDRRNAKRARWAVALRRGTMPHEAAWREQEHVRSLLAAGLPVMRPAAWGERRVLGVGRESFLLVEGVDGRDLSVVYSQADGVSRLRLLRAMGELLGQLHSRGFFETVRLRDVFCTALPEDPSLPVSLVLIDRDTYAPRAQQPMIRRCFEEAARCYCKFLQQDHRLSRTEVRVFISGYCRGLGAHWPLPSARILGPIAAEVARLTAPGRKYHGIVESIAFARRG